MNKYGKKSLINSKIDVFITTRIFVQFDKNGGKDNKKQSSLKDLQVEPIRIASSVVDAFGKLSRLDEKWNLAPHLIQALKK